MMIKLRYIALILCLVASSGLGAARNYEFQLLAGSRYVELDFNVRHPLEEGYLRTGVGGAYRDQTNQKYSLLHGTIGVGSTSFVEGLRVDVGFRGLVTKVENRPMDGSGGGLGFNIAALYQLPEKISKLPIRFFGELTWAPDVLCFSSLDRYREINTGVSFNIIDNAAIILDYRYRNFDMKTNWGLSDDIVSVGVAVGF
ncbi:YfaZ family outer membrane protein [Planctomycetota bacterium]